MTNDLIQLIDSLMVNIPAGEVVLRDDRIKKEWLVQIQPFLLAKYAVTMELYDAITNSTLNNFDKNHKPVVNISWNDAIAFCNVLSKKAGLKEYYSISDGGQIVIQMATDYHLRRSGNMHVKQVQTDIHTGNFMI